MDWTSVIKSIAPTVATALLGPLGGVAVSALGNVLGVSEATQDKIAEVVKSAGMTPEIVKALVDVIGVWSVILITANTVSKIVVWHFTKGTKP